MSNIIHESTGAPSRNLAVTGVELAVQQVANLIIDLRNYIGATWGTYLTWTDQKFSKDFTPFVYSGTQARQSPQQGLAIKGASSLTFGLAESPNPYDRNLVSQDFALTSYGQNAAGYTVAIVCRPAVGVGTDQQTLFQLHTTYSSPNYIRCMNVYLNTATTQLITELYTLPTHHVTVTHNVAALANSWHVIVLSASFADKKVEISIDGTTAVEYASLTALDTQASGYGRCPAIGAYVDCQGTVLPLLSMRGALAAVQSWKVALSAAECQVQGLYLMNLYGLL